MDQGSVAVHEKRKHFRHHAHAVGLAGHLTLPFQQLIEAQASCALPHMGGHASHRADNFRVADVVSCGAAHSTVTGSYSEKDDAFFTVTSTTIENLDILGVVKASKICGRIMCRHPWIHPKDVEKAAVTEPSIVPLGSHFENLTVAGHPVTVKLRVGKACELDTYSRFRKDWKSDPEPWYADPGDPKSAIHCSLVDKLEYADAPELQRKTPDSLYLDHFGTIRFAQFLVNPKAREITMLEVELGCGFEGRLMVCIGQGNGIGPQPGGN
jgi:hypothetical protein